MSLQATTTVISRALHHQYTLILRSQISHKYLTLFSQIGLNVHCSQYLRNHSQILLRNCSLISQRLFTNGKQIVHKYLTICSQITLTIIHEEHRLDQYPFCCILFCSEQVFCTIEFCLMDLNLLFRRKSRNLKFYHILMTVSSRKEIRL